MAEKDDKPTPHSAAAIAREQEKTRSEAAKLSDKLRQSTEDLKLRDRMGHALGMGNDNIKLRKTSDQNLELTDALLKDIKTHSWNRLEFAHALGQNPNTVNWWFTKGAIPYARQLEVVEVLGTRSLSFKILLDRARRDAEDGSKTARAQIHMLQGLAEFTDFLARDDWGDRNMSIVQVIDEFEKLHPNHKTIANYKRKLFGAAISKAKGIPAIPIPSKMAKSVLNMQVSGEVVRNRKLYFISSKDEEDFYHMIDNMDWGSELKPLPQAKRVGKSGQNRPHIRIATDKFVVAPVHTSWMINPTRDGREEQVPFLSIVRAAAWELMQVKLEDEVNKIQREYMLVIYDKVDLYNQNTWYSQVFNDIKNMGLTPLLDEQLGWLSESVGEHINKILGKEEPPKDDTLYQGDPDDDPSVEIH